VTGVTLEGAQYPLLGETLAPGGFAAISNRVDLSPLLISIGEGSVLVAVDREAGPEYVEDIFGDD
jgi:thiamine pyrophosphokinase